MGKNNKKLTTNDFIIRSKLIHGNVYDYSLVNYKNAHDKVKIICKNHGIFTQIPHHHYEGMGCKKCGWSEIDRIEFIERSARIHKNKYDYSKFIYTNYNTKSIITCPIHGNFLQSPKKHLENNGCLKCGIENRKSTTNKFIKESNKIHNFFYNYSLVNYTKSDEKITIICPKHNKFLQTPNHHLCGQGCPKCTNISSKLEIEFLDYLKIPDTKENRQVLILRKKVDGYDDKTKTIYEFLGDYWHGNPKRHNPAHIHPIIKKRFGCLYKETFSKFRKLKKLGYIVKYIWEGDWNNYKNNITINPKILEF